MCSLINIIKVKENKYTYYYFIPLTPQEIATDCLRLSANKIKQEAHGPYERLEYNNRKVWFSFKQSNVLSEIGKVKRFSKKNIHI